MRSGAKPDDAPEPAITLETALAECDRLGLALSWEAFCAKYPTISRREIGRRVGWRSRTLLNGAALLFLPAAFLYFFPGDPRIELAVGGAWAVGVLYASFSRCASWLQFERAAPALQPTGGSETARRQQFTQVKARVVRALKSDIGPTEDCSPRALADDLSLLLNLGESILGSSFRVSPEELQHRSTLISMTRLLCLRPPTQYEQANLCEVVRRFLILYETHTLPTLPALKEGPGLPPRLPTWSEHQDLVALQVEYTNNETGDNLAFMAALAAAGGLGLALASGGATLAASAANAVGGGLLGAMAGSAVQTGVAQVPSVLKAFDKAPASKKPSLSPVRSQYLEWTTFFDVEVPSTHEQMRLLHRRAEQRHRTFVGEREQILSMWQQRVRDLNRKLPYQHPGKRTIHPRRWRLVASVLLCAGATLATEYAIVHRFTEAASSTVMVTVALAGVLASSIPAFALLNDVSLIPPKAALPGWTDLLDYTLQIRQSQNP